MTEESTVENVCTIDDFAKLDLRVGTIIEAERVEGSEKLLKFQVDFGTEKRQILSGIAKSYAPEDLLQKQVVALINLPPRSMMGMESQGMLLCATRDGGGSVVLFPETAVANGSDIR